MSRTCRTTRPSRGCHQRPHPPRPGLTMSPEATAGFRRQAEQDLVLFLQCRARELVPGGKLLLENKRGQVSFFRYFSFTFFGLPFGRMDDSSPKATAVCSCHWSSPYGAPRNTDSRNAVSSLSVFAALTCSVQSPGRRSGPSLSQDTCVPCIRCHQLDQRHSWARSTLLARNGLRST
jgi:hypothetical protein